jgi:tetratricopeptide (TPR) repeat protein
MKKNILVSVLSIFSFCAFAQNSAVTNAILYHKDGTLDKAREEIDQAVYNDKTKVEAKAWYYKGVIYSDISRSANPAYKNLSADPLKEAYEAFSMSMQLDPAKGEYYKLSEKKLKELWADVINKGITEYEAEKTEEAVKTFEMAQKIMPADTAAYIYASYAAEALGNDALLKKYTNELVKLNHKSAYMYRNRIYLESDNAKKLEISKQALADFPKDEGLLEMQAEIFSDLGMNKEALENLIKINSASPGNVTILTKIAVQYEKLKDVDKALDTYNTILAIEKTNYLANFNTAIIYFEKGKAENDKVHKLNVDEYHKQGKELEEEANKHFNIALNHAQIALKQCTDEDDKKNINLIIADVNKMLKK